MLEVYLQGLILGFSLIMAIGAQNVIVLRNGIQNIYPFWTASICSLSDIILIALGIGGLGVLISQNIILMEFAKWGGATYLLWMSFTYFRACFRAEKLVVDKQNINVSFKTAMSTVLVVTFLNPHVYLDTVVLLGSIGAQFQQNQRVYFATGTMSAGLIWFFSLSMAGKLLSPLLSKPQVWRILNGIIGVMLIYVAFTILTM